MRRIVTPACLAALIAASTTLALAADFPFKKETEARQGMMQVASFNLGILAAMAKGEREYDAGLATASAKNVHLASMIDQRAMWPKGSDTANLELDGKTMAKPEIWANFDDVMKKHDAWEAAAAKLAGEAGKGVDALRPVVGEAGKACKACHDDYRQKP